MDCGLPGAGAPSERRFAQGLSRDYLYRVCPAVGMFITGPGSSCFCKLRAEMLFCFYECGQGSNLDLLGKGVCLLAWIYHMDVIKFQIGQGDPHG